MKEKILFGKTKDILSATKDDSEMNKALGKKFSTLASRIPRTGTYIFLRTSILPDETPAIFAYDKENRMIVSSYTEFASDQGTEYVYVYLSLWCSSLSKYENGLTVLLQRYEKGKLDPKTAKLVSSKAKTLVKKISNMFPDEKKASKCIRNIY